MTRGCYCKIRVLAIVWVVRTAAIEVGILIIACFDTADGCNGMENQVNYKINSDVSGPVINTHNSPVASIPLASFRVVHFNARVASSISNLDAIRHST